MALGREEGEDHPAADQQLVRLADEVLDHGQLVGDLGPAHDHHERALGVGDDLVEHVHLGLHEIPQVAGQHVGDVVHRGVLAVHGAEGVVHVRAVLPREGGELAREGLPLGVVLGGLARVVAHVLEHEDLPVLQCIGLGPGVLTHDVGGHDHGRLGELRQPVGGRLDGVLGVHGSLGAAEVGHDDDARSGAGELLEHRQRGPHATVVGHGGAVQRHVEVRAHEHAASRDALRNEIVQ